MPYKIDPKTGKKIEYDPITGQPINQEPTPSTSGMTTQSADIFKQPEKPQTPTEQNIATHNENRTFFQKAGDFLLPRATKLTEKLASSYILGKDTDRQNKVYGEFKTISDDFVKKANAEKDPAKRKKYYDLAEQALDAGSKGYAENIKNYEESAGVSIEEDTNMFRESAGVAGEIGTFFIPADKLAKGAKLTTKILSGAKLGGKAGLLLGATDPRELKLDERAVETVKQGGMGFISGALVSSMYEVPKSAIKSTFGDSSRRLARVLKIPKTDRIEFQRNTGMIPEEEVLARHGQEIAGKDHAELSVFFQDKAQEAINSKSTLLGEIKIDPKKLGALNNEAVGLIDDAIAQSDQGYLQEGAVPRLQKLRQQIIDKPINSYNALDEVKSALQNEAKSAYSANGTPSNTSKALANAASKFQKFIEEAGTKGENNLVKEANANIQLYKMLENSTKSASATEMNKISNDLVGKMLQFMPLAVAGAAGYGGYKQGGVEGGFGSFMVASMLMGGGSAARGKYLTPEVQTALASKFSKILSSQGVKQADGAAKNIVDNIIRVAAIRASDKIEEPKNVVDQQSQSIGNTENNISNTDPNQQFIHNGSIPPATGNTSGMEQGSGATMANTITIRNTETGEVKKIKREEMSQYGVGEDAESTNGMPTSDDIVKAMVVDYHTTGGKNMAKLNSLLDAVTAQEGKFGGGKGKVVPATQAQALADFDSAISLMDEVDVLITNQGNLFGPFTGTAGKLNPYATNTQIADADLRRAAQIVGKAMEGGVLRKEDEIKYRRMLPNLSDTPAVAEGKMKNVKQMLINNRQQRVDALVQAGYDPEKRSFEDAPMGIQFQDGSLAL